jgi:hypothetical protein
MDEYSESIINMAYTSLGCECLINSRESMENSVGASYLKRNTRKCTCMLHF